MDSPNLPQDSNRCIFLHKPGGCHGQTEPGITHCLGLVPEDSMVLGTVKDVLFIFGVAFEREILGIRGRSEQRCLCYPQVQRKFEVATRLFR